MCSRTHAPVALYSPSCIRVIVPQHHHHQRKQHMYCSVYVILMYHRQCRRDIDARMSYADAYICGCCIKALIIRCIYDMHQHAAMFFFADVWLIILSSLHYTRDEQFIFSDLLRVHDDGRAAISAIKPVTVLLYNIKAC